MARRTDSGGGAAALLVESPPRLARAGTHWPWLPCAAAEPPTSVCPPPAASCACPVPYVAHAQASSTATGRKERSTHAQLRVLWSVPWQATSPARSSFAPPDAVPVSPPHRRSACIARPLSSPASRAGRRSPAQPAPPEVTDVGRQLVRLLSRSDGCRAANERACCTPGTLAPYEPRGREVNPRRNRATATGGHLSHTCISCGFVSCRNRSVALTAVSSMKAFCTVALSAMTPRSAALPTLLSELLASPSELSASPSDLLASHSVAQRGDALETLPCVGAASSSAHQAGTGRWTRCADVHDVFSTARVRARSPSLPL